MSNEIIPLTVEFDESIPMPVEFQWKISTASGNLRKKFQCQRNFNGITYPCENEVGFIGTVLELSGTHFNGTFWDNHLIPINPNIGIIWY